MTATDPDSLLRQALGEMYNGISEHEMYKALYLSARARIEKEPEYSQVSARLLLAVLRVEIIGRPVSRAQMTELYPDHLRDMLNAALAPNC